VAKFVFWSQQDLSGGQQASRLYCRPRRPSVRLDVQPQGMLTIEVILSVAPLHRLHGVVKQGTRASTGEAARVRRKSSRWTQVRWLQRSYRSLRLTRGQAILLALADPHDLPSPTLVCLLLSMSYP